MLMQKNTSENFLIQVMKAVKDSFCYSFKQYFLPRVKIENYSIESDGRKFYDQPINDSIEQYVEVRKVLTGQ